MNATISVAIEPLIRKKIFNTEEEAIREREYILRQIAALKRKIGRFDESMGYASSSLTIISMKDRFCWKKMSFQ